VSDFPAFFKDLWVSERWPDPEPFPWQTMLAQRAADGDWPRVISLPTASGKTACLDAAVFGLAATALHDAGQRLPRRIWFVVDRRIVVDEAFERARRIASKLEGADGGPIEEVARALRSLSGTGRALRVARLRGGAWISDDWARRPSQPTIICSTVDQVGSALLFRAYGHSDETASIYAGLTAHDSLIILDEAHCAVPFMQTLEAVARYRDEPWAERPLRTPFRYCVMSATLPDTVGGTAMFPMPSQRAEALDHPLLEKRIRARKLASVEKPVKGDEDEFASAAAGLVEHFRGGGRSRIAVMVNRVATAKRIAERLRVELGDAADVVLLTGRIRPLDRDVLLRKWADLLKAGSTEHVEKPIVLVTTQCLEVGADFSFDALVTECASLDSLRQRFGRLDRLGDLGESGAAILVRERDAKQPKTDGDPVYGRAIYETWRWLNEPEQRQAGATVDFGIAAMDERVDALRAADGERFRKLLAPWEDAPVLLPAHLDLFSQTSPRPVPEPDEALFLHGKRRPAAEVRVVFRADLDGTDEDIDVLSLLPPTSTEALVVPMHRLKTWLLQGRGDDNGGDVEGLGDEGEADPQETASRKFVIWKGPKHSELTDDPGRLRPDDVVVLGLSKEGISELGQVIDNPEGLGPDSLDLAEHAFSQARRKAVLRINRDVLGPMCAYSSVAELLTVVDSDSDPDVRSALQGVLDEDDERHRDPGSPTLPEWLRKIITSLRGDARIRVEDHPYGGLILVGKANFQASDADLEEDTYADAEDLTSESAAPVSLREHTAAVASVASEFAGLCIDRDFHDVFADAARVHDLGKLDWRFQLLLGGGDWTEMSNGEPLAKSARLPKGRRRRREIEEDARLPKDFRHELLSMQLAERFGLGPADEESRDLLLHLVGSHHGYARPFAPLAPDKLVSEGRAADLDLGAIGIQALLTGPERRVIGPAYRLDSGVPDRFWRLTRRYGWWGLAYLESVFRLSDWAASRRAGDGERLAPMTLKVREVAPSVSPNRLCLDALDGANPLAFLAALGALRILSRVSPDYRPRLSWEQRLGAWRPVLWTDQRIEEARICEMLYRSGLDLGTMFSDGLLAASVSVSPKNKKGEASWMDKLKFPVADFRAFCRAASDRPSPSAEFAAAWAGETAPSSEAETNIALRTRFDFTAGQQAFIGMVRELKKGCSPADLQRSLFTGWLYSAGAVSMRWDTQDEKRQYALQSSDPTKSDNPPMAEHGANFLAIEALPLFPIVPNRGAEQAGFEGKGDSRSWSWPIWAAPIGLDTVRSLLAVPLTDSAAWHSANRQQMGVATVFQSRIVMPSGRYRCFTPARSV
jgi:CRISPR-associated endonuclease/helicase Cas3